MFYLGQKFGRELPPDLSEYCGLTGSVLMPFGLEGWQIAQSKEVEISDEMARMRSILREELQESDWRALREYDRFMEDPTYKIDKRVFAYRRYLREFDGQPGQWWDFDVLSFNEFVEREEEQNDNDQ
jgi:hypothetical protein